MNTTLELTAPATKANTAKQKILLVDDDAAIRRILMRLLTEEDYLVLTAANGGEALVLAESAKFDLVLLDLNMPVKNGWETFEHLTTKHPLIPIILITARPNQKFPALASGAGALMEKPLDFARLFQTIHELLEEPEELRQARLAGRTAAFGYVPPIPGQPEGKTSRSK